MPWKVSILEFFPQVARICITAQRCIDMIRHKQARKFFDWGEKDCTKTTLQTEEEKFCSCSFNRNILWLKECQGQKEFTKTILKPEEEKVLFAIGVHWQLLCGYYWTTSWTTWELLGDLCVATWWPLLEHAGTTNWWIQTWYLSKKCRDRSFSGKTIMSKQIPQFTEI